VPVLRPLRGCAALAAVLVAALVAAPLLPAAAAADPAPARPSASLRSAVDAGETSLGGLPRGTIRRAPGALRTQSRTGEGTGPVATGSLTAADVSTFRVEFVDDGATWSPEAKAAFQAAVDVWERVVESAVPIEVRATATTFAEPDLLGGAGPADFRRDDRGTPGLADDVFEPIALFNAKRRVDAVPGEPDVLADFDPGLGGLYFGTDGNPPADRIDFKTVVLHELGHGLGLVGTARVEGGRGAVGDSDINDGAARSGVSFDQFTYASTTEQAGDGGGRVLDLPDGSPELLQALTGQRLYWSGQLGRTAAGGGTLPLYAPAEWLEGTSYGHLDEDPYRGEHPDGLMTPFLHPGESLGQPGQIAMGLLADMGWAVPAARGSRYTAVEPVRVLDTRGDAGQDVGVRRGPVGPGSVVDLPVVGRAGVPVGATAVVLNVIGVSPTGPTDLRVYPVPVVGAPVPSTSNVNLAGGTRANLVTVPVGHKGRVRFRNTSGSVHVVADLAGWYAPSGTSTFTAADPVRVLDTRGQDGREVGSAIGPVEGGGFVDLSVVRNGPVPSDASAVALTVTAVAPTTDTDVRVYPAPAEGTLFPRVSSVNAGAGSVVPNVVIVPLGQDGTVRLRNAAGRVHLLADVAGWYDGSDSGGLFRPVGPTRVLDTRPSVVGPGQDVELRVGGLTRVPSLATAAVLNVTGVAASQATDVRVYPGGGSAVPRVSNLNLSPGQTAADLVVVKLGGGTVRLRNAAGTVGLVADVAGWFGPAA